MNDYHGTHRICDLCEKNIPHEHDCPNWDYMTIKPGDPEMDGCSCFSQRVVESTSRQE